MAKIRVLVVDDSVVIRRLLFHALSSDPEIEVVGTAADGQIALEKTEQLSPDILILDLMMPVMDGYETIKQLRKSHKNIPVIVFSVISEAGATATLDALALGANDYVTKAPKNSLGMDHLYNELIPKIKALCRRDTVALASAFKTDARNDETPSQAGALAVGPVKILAIGVSTGGPNALAALLPDLTRSLPVPVVIVQHMPEMFTRLLADRLAAASGFPVYEGRTGEVLRPGMIWVAPGGHHLEVEDTGEGVRLRTTDSPPENSCRPAVDVLFRSVARVYGTGTLALVLTGMGQDGLRGCERIREAGGRILAQDEASSVVWGMPGAVSRAGLAEKVMPLSEIAAEVNRRVLNCSKIDLKTRPDVLRPQLVLAKAL